MAATILGISPGTRSLGIGVIRNSELIEWQVKTFKGKWSKEKMERIEKMIIDLSTHFSVTTIALKQVSPLKSSDNLSKLANAIMALARKRRIQLRLYSIHDLKRTAGQRGKHSKNELMEFITEQYPILRKEYLKERNNLNPYYLRMFEAVAAAQLAGRE